MGKEISIKGIRYWGLNANLNGVSFNEDKLFGFDITDANKIKEKILEKAKENKEKIEFKEYGDITKEYISILSPTSLYYKLLEQHGFPINKLNEEGKKYIDSLFNNFCDNINCFKTGIVVLFLDGYAYKKKKVFKKTKQYLLSIQSASDVITNSSSEMFCVSSKKSKEDLYDLLRNYSSTYDKGHASGEGGSLDIYEVDYLNLVKCLYGDNPNIISNINKKFIEIYKEAYGLSKEGVLYLVDIDQGFYNTHDFIQNKLNGKPLG